MLGSVTVNFTNCLLRASHFLYQCKCIGSKLPGYPLSIKYAAICIYLHMKDVKEVQVAEGTTVDLRVVSLNLGCVITGKKTSTGFQLYITGLMLPTLDV